MEESALASSFSLSLAVFLYVGTEMKSEVGELYDCWGHNGGGGVDPPKPQEIKIKNVPKQSQKRYFSRISTECNLQFAGVSIERREALQWVTLRDDLDSQL